MARTRRRPDRSAHLSTHLFGDGGPPTLTMARTCRPRRCDRLRADLSGLVPAGSGLHLLDPASAPVRTPDAVSPPVGGLGNVTYPVALNVVGDLLRTHVARLGSDPGLVVLVEGTALAAHGVRATSEDVDLHMPEQDDAVVAEVAARHAPALGPAFRLDVTPSDTLWGRMPVRDIGCMPMVGEVAAGRFLVPVRALDLATLYVLKAAANRPKDVEDLRAIAPRVWKAGLLARATTMVGWYGDRGRIVPFLDALVSALSLDFGMDAADVEAALVLREGHRGALAAHRETLARRRAMAEAAASRATWA